jgi:hypothetical protein
LSKKELEKVQKEERKIQRQKDRALVLQQKENFENDLAEMDKAKVGTKKPLIY